jgi:hypothetical protein
LAADTDDAFRHLNDAGLVASEQFGVRRAVAAGECRHREGDAGYDVTMFGGNHPDASRSSRS